jgi:ribosomal protein S12 methylthiotransferase accessory factor
MRQVLVVDLTKKHLGVPVVRVVIPGLEGPFEHEQGDYVPGPRARRLVGRGFPGMAA